MALGRERAQAAIRVDDLRAELDEIIVAAIADAPDDEHDAEGSTVGFERARVTALLAHARDYLADLDLAEQRRRAGTYGRCVGCGEVIAAERLEARPAVLACILCAAR